MKSNDQRHRRQKQALYVFVGCLSGVVEKITAHKSLQGAQRDFVKYTGRQHEEVLKAISANCDLTPADILGEKFDECKILKVTLRS